jgi:hypothetical protein
LPPFGRQNRNWTLGRAKRKGVGGKEFLPAPAFAASFFAAAIFRANEIGPPLLHKTIMYFSKKFVQFQSNIINSICITRKLFLKITDIK